MIYLDHAATTPIKPEAALAITEILENPGLYANPSSSHRLGKAAKSKLDEFRQKAAGQFNCEPDEVVFNSGGSEGDTHALAGMSRLLGGVIHVAISAVEHEAVQDAAAQLEASGSRVTAIPVTGDGVIDLGFLSNIISQDKPDLVSVMAVNNETGVVQPWQEVSRACAANGVAYHCDAVRAVGHGFGDLMQDPNITLLNCTAHKFGGPRGVGILIQRGIKLPRLVCGGSQEGGSRAGTENLAGIAGLLKALELATDEESERVEEMRRRMEHELVVRFPFCEIHGKRAPRATHITSVSFKPKSGLKLQEALDARGIALGTGSACHEGGEVTVSPVLRALGVEDLLARGTLRISLGWNTTRNDISTFMQALDELVYSEDAEALNCEI